MQLRYVFSELAQGLRRNLSMHVAVILTLFVSLTLVGLGVLLNQQAIRAGEQWGNELQITVFLCRDGDENPACPTEVTGAQQQAIEKVVDENPEVASYYVESKAEAFEKVKELFGPEKFEGPNAAATADDMAKSVWITLEDPDEYEGILSAVQGLDGVGSVRDQRAVVGPILRGIEAMQWGALAIAGVPRRRGAAAGRQHHPARGDGAPQGDRHHAAGGRLDALHRAAVPARGAGDRADRRRPRRGGDGRVHVLRRRRQPARTSSASSRGSGCPSS